MIWAAVLAVSIPPPSAETLELYAPKIPADAIVHTTSCGEEIYIVPEPKKLQTFEREETERYWGPRCGMPCGNPNHFGWCTRVKKVSYQADPNTPTPLDKLEKALDHLELTEEDVIYDLGCGDGRVLILAIKKYGCKGVGIDNRQDALDLARSNAQMNGVAADIEFYPYDIREVTLSRPTVLYCYLGDELMPVVQKLINDHPKIRAALSYHYAFVGESRKIGDFYLWSKSTERIARQPSPSRVPT